MDLQKILIDDREQQQQQQPRQQPDIGPDCLHPTIRQNVSILERQLSKRSRSISPTIMSPGNEQKGEPQKPQKEAASLRTPNNSPVSVRSRSQSPDLDLTGAQQTTTVPQITTSQGYQAPIRPNHFADTWLARNTRAWAESMTTATEGATMQPTCMSRRPATPGTPTSTGAQTYTATASSEVEWKRCQTYPATTSSEIEWKPLEVTAFQAQEEAMSLVRSPAMSSTTQTGSPAGSTESTPTHTVPSDAVCPTCRREPDTCSCVRPPAYPYNQYQYQQGTPHYPLQYPNYQHQYYYNHWSQGHQGQ